MTEAPSIQRRRPIQGNGETGYQPKHSVSVTVLSCGHETTDGWAATTPPTKSKGHWYFCVSCRRWRKAA